MLSVIEVLTLTYDISSDIRGGIRSEKQGRDVKTSALTFPLHPQCKHQNTNMTVIPDV